MEMSIFNFILCFTIFNTKFEQNQQNCINIVSKVFEEGKCKVRKLPINCQIKMIFIYWE